MDPAKLNLIITEPKVGLICKRTAGVVLRPSRLEFHGTASLPRSLCFASELFEKHVLTHGMNGLGDFAVANGNAAPFRHGSDWAEHSLARIANGTNSLSSQMSGMLQEVPRLHLHHIAPLPNNALCSIES